MKKVSFIFGGIILMIILIGCTQLELSVSTSPTDPNLTSEPSAVDEIDQPTSYYTTLENQNFIPGGLMNIPLQIRQIQNNYSKGITLKPEYIVIHETNNYAVGANANAHYRYWNNNPSAQASTHFVVDDREIYQMLSLDQVAWHVGDNKGHSPITNYNSIGIEIAVNSDGNYYTARQNAIALTIQVMNYLGMDISQLKRHYDASGKYCPKNMLDQPELWDDFVLQVSLGL